MWYGEISTLAESTTYENTRLSCCQLINNENNES